MRETGSSARRDRIVAFAALVEAATGLALLVAPALVANLLLGVDGSAVAALFARLFGIALLALALACWPLGRGRGSDNDPAAWRSMLAYNVLMSIYLAYVGAIEQLAGPLLWPAVLFHLAVTALLLWTGCGTSMTTAGSGRAR